MKKSDFDKNIKIYSIASNHYQGLGLKSILYTPIPYRIPVAFADTANSADDTEKYIKETYSKKEQEALAYNDKINTEFWNELLNNPFKLSLLKFKVNIFLFLSKFILVIILEVLLL